MYTNFVITGKSKSAGISGGGSLWCQSPEQDLGAPVTRSSDIFSLGGLQTIRK